MYTVFEVSASENWVDTGSSYTFKSYEKAMEFIDDEFSAWACCLEIEGFMSLSHEGRLVQFWCACRHEPGYAEASYGQNYY